VPRRIIGPKLGGFENFLSGHGWAGPARNIALLYGAGMDSSDPSFQLVDCVGIATATSEALHDARHKVRVPGTTVSVANRIVRGSYHSATGVAFDRGWYVFDWWKTLDPDNPFLYRHGLGARSESGYIPPLQRLLS
jgi:hypothetical protein